MALIAIVSEFEVVGIVKVVTVGAVVSAVPEDGWLVASPGKVRALISVILEYPSLSESSGSIVLKAPAGFVECVETLSKDVP